MDSKDTKESLEREIRSLREMMWTMSGIFHDKISQLEERCAALTEDANKILEEGDGIQNEKEPDEPYEHVKISTRCGCTSWWPWETPYFCTCAVCVSLSPQLNPKYPTPQRYPSPSLDPPSWEADVHIESPTPQRYPTYPPPLDLPSPSQVMEAPTKKAKTNISDWSSD